MLWAVASSAFVIYLYRKLNAEKAVGAAAAENGSPIRAASTSPLSAVDAELAKLNDHISALEGKLSKV